MIPFLEQVIAAIVWAVANIVYIDMKRKGVHGFTRFAAFWVGNPTTWITLFALEDGVAPSFEPDADDDELLDEVRLDRARRIASGEVEDIDEE